MRGTAAELAARFPEPPKGEIMLVVDGGARRRSTTPPRRRPWPSSSMRACPAGAAADLVARLTGVSRNALYRRSL